MGIKRKILIVIILFIILAVPVVDQYVQYGSDPIRIKYLNVMKNLKTNETKTALRNEFDKRNKLDKNYNFTDLYKWVHENLNFSHNDPPERSTDPLQILQIGEGKCQEFSILYVALCLVHGYQSRLVIAIDAQYPNLWYPQHAWAEVKISGQWIHVDPSDQIWNQTSYYQSWEWGKGIGSWIHIYAFEEGKVIDVTQQYQN